jgi:hypothetical protein
VIARSKLLPLLVLFVLLLAAPAVADAATLAVDDDGAQCPAAEFTKVQAAVDAAAPGDTIAVCPGIYVEGSGSTGTNALTITKSLTLKGAGADLVAIEPKRSTPTGGQIAESKMDIRNGRGDIISAVGAVAAPITVNISGVTVNGNGVFAEAGIVYLDAQGELARDRVTHIVTSISNSAYELLGGYRSNQFGYGIAQVTAAATPPADAAPRPLVIDHTRVDEYNKVGILISGATGEVTPLTSSGVVNSGVLEADQVIGRVQCLPFNTPTPPPYVLGGAGATPTNQLPGNCSTVGLTTSGPTYGQDGVRVSGGAKVSIKDSTIAQNLVNGAAAPAYGATTNNENLSLGAGLRLIGAGPSTVTHSNITDNAYGAYNVGLDGTAPNTANPLGAIENWWGLAVKATANLGPAISPTTNPAYQENPVNGAAEADGAGTTSNAVDFFPFRNGSESDPNTGELPVVYAPLPVNDAAPTVSLSTDKPAYERGETVTLTAAASDDFGVTEITFYEGTTPIATVVPPADTATLTIPADAACTTRTVSAVASDFLGQTGSAATTFVGGPNACKEPETPGGGGGGETPGGGGGGTGTTPPPASPNAPSVSLVSPPATIGEAGTTLTAAPVADTAAGASVAKVDFFLGNRLLCTVTAAPYTCKVLPEGSEVGTQALRAVVTDSGGRTATAEASTKVAKFTPADLTLEAEALKAKKGKGKPKLRRKLSGTLELPDRVTAAQGCASGTVAITVTRDDKTVLPSTQVSLGARCTYSLTLTVPAKQSKSTFKATAKFGGNAVLLPASTTRRFN